MGGESWVSKSPTNFTLKCEVTHKDFLILEKKFIVIDNFLEIISNNPLFLLEFLGYSQRH